MKSLSGSGAIRRGVARSLAVGVLLGSAGLGMTATAGSASAANPNNYELFAQGDGMYLLISNFNLPAGLPGAISPYAANAQTNSNAQTKGFAGAPYLGPLVQTLPGLVGGLSGARVPPLPPLPGFVESSTPSNLKQRQAQGPYVLESVSDDSGTASTVGVGVAAQADGNPQAFARASVKANDDGSTLAQAAAGVTGAVVGPVSLLDVSTNISVLSDPDGKTTVLNTTNFGTISVAGIKLGLTESGFTLLGAKVDVPTKAVFDTLNTILAASKTKISLIQSSEVKDEETGRITVQSGGLRLQTVQDIPGLGDVNVDYVFGRSTVRSRNTPIGGVAPTTDGATGASSGTTAPATGTTGTPVPPETSGGTGDTTGLSGGATTDSGLAPVDPGLPVDPSTSGTDPVFPPDESTSGQGGVASGSSGGTPTSPVALGSTGGAQLGDNTELLYLTLVLGGLGAFVGQQLFSRFGVQLLLRQP